MKQLLARIERLEATCRPQEDIIAVQIDNFRYTIPNRNGFFTLEQLNQMIPLHKKLYIVDLFMNLPNMQHKI